MAYHLVMFLGKPAQPELTPVEEAMEGLLRACASATLKTAQTGGLFERLLVISNDRSFVIPAGVELRYSREETSFHYGRTLLEVTRELPPGDGVICLGAGAASLFTVVEWQAAVAALENGPASVTANNFFSADVIGWKPAAALTELARQELLPASDNNLAWLLCHRAGLTWRPFLPGAGRTARTIFDLDTPTDAATLKLWLDNRDDRSEPALFLRKNTVLDSGPVRSFLEELGQLEGQVLVAGRVSGGVHRLLETRAHGQSRVLSEERGMRASGREEQGKVVSLTGCMLEELGPAGFFKRLSRLATAIALDTRVLFAHMRREFSRADRFNSDAFQPHEIKDPYLREFTETALEAYSKGLRVVLGGHSLVAGDLMLLLEMVPPRY